MHSCNYYRLPFFSSPHSAARFQIYPLTLTSRRNFWNSRKFRKNRLFDGEKCIFIGDVLLTSGLFFSFQGK